MVNLHWSLKRSIIHAVIEWYKIRSSELHLALPFNNKAYIRFIMQLVSGSPARDSILQDNPEPAPEIAITFDMNNHVNYIE